jgi:hypothetical protein
MGFGSLEELLQVKHWRMGESYRKVCEKSGWGVEWVDDVFDAAESLVGEPPVVREKLMRGALARLKKRVKE